MMNDEIGNWKFFWHDNALRPCGVWSLIRVGEQGLLPIYLQWHFISFVFDKYYYQKH